jgi:hypothetical protein
LSRLAVFSPAALRAMFSPDADASLMILLTISGEDIDQTIRVCDSYTQRLSTTGPEIIYGTISRGKEFIFLPMNISLPTEEQMAAPRCSITLHDVTRYLTPVIRTIHTSPNVLMELVLNTTPDNVEASYPGFIMSGITYNKDVITAELTVEHLTNEPFPAGTFLPSYFPGLY